MDDAYTGHVEPDGDWQDRRDGALCIRKLSVGTLDNNVYVVSCVGTRASLLIDVAARPERLREALTDTTPLAAVMTHGHGDHTGAWQALSADPGLEVWGHRGDAKLFPQPVDRHLDHGETIEVGEIRVEVLHVPGHTDGSLLYLVEGATRPHLFSGDTLFPGGHGKTTSRSAHDLIMDGLEREVFARLPDETWVYPGHGDDTTIGTERPHLGEWRARGW